MEDSTFIVHTDTGPLNRCGRCKKVCHFFSEMSCDVHRLLKILNVINVFSPIISYQINIEIFHFKTNPSFATFRKHTLEI